MSDLVREHRVRFVFIAPEEVLAMFCQTKMILFPQIEDLPEDAFVVDAHFENTMRMYGFKIASKEFDPVTPGDIIPNIGVRRIVLKRTFDKVEEYKDGK